MNDEMWYTNGTKYDADNRVTEVKYDDSDTHKVNLTYDLLNRVTNKTVTNGVPYSTTYGYVTGDTASYGANATTPLIETITQGSGVNAMNFAYTYDSRGNIVSETRNGVTTTYEYDELGQLVRVNDPNDPAADSVRGTTWVYSYDRGGNILQKLAYVLSSDAHPSELRQSLIYEYTDANWKDKLTLFCNDELEYDAIGNLTDDGQWTYTWEKGRQLKSMHNANTGVTMEFKYNQNGIRTQKVKKVNGAVTETTDYILKGKTVAAMKKNTDTYYFTYDASGNPATVNFNGANYTYIKNLQNDIVGILDAFGNLVVEYKYDAWGDAVSIYSASTTVDSLAFDNPFRYRGYVWDEETGLYYLRSRYYIPKHGRFIQPDSLLSDGLGNLYSYTNNNGISCIDIDGYKTYAIGYQTSAVLGPASISIAEGICWDDKGNKGRFVTYGGLEGNFIINEDLLKDYSTVTVGVGYVSVVDFYQETNLPSIYELNGISSSIGISFNLGASLGVDFLYQNSISSSENQFIGVQTSTGAGFGLDFGHETNCYTIVYPVENTGSPAGRAVSSRGAKLLSISKDVPKKENKTSRSLKDSTRFLCK